MNEYVFQFLAVEMASHKMINEALFRVLHPITALTDAFLMQKMIPIKKTKVSQSGRLERRVQVESFGVRDKQAQAGVGAGAGPVAPPRENKQEKHKAPMERMLSGAVLAESNDPDGGRVHEVRQHAHP